MDKNNKPNTTIKRRLTAVLLALVFIVNTLLPYSPLSVVRPASADDAEGMHLSIEWAENEFKDGSAMRVYEPNDTTNAVKIRVSYNSEKVREAGYAPGELIITLKGLGPVYRGRYPEAAGVGADPADSDTKTRDWTWSYNSETGEYVFVNNNAIRPNSVFSGYFDIVWDLSARRCTDGFSQDDISASFLLPDGSELSSNSLSFSHDTRCDVYGAAIETGVIYSNEGLTAGLSNPEDYIFVKYLLDSPRSLNSRGLEEGAYYYFDPDVDDIGTGAIVISPELTCEGADDDPNAVGTGTGIYKVGLAPGAKAGSQPIFVAYPAASYGGRTVTAGTYVTGAFYEGDDNGVTEISLLAQDTCEQANPNTFTFTDPGPVQKYYKEANIDETARKKNGGDIKGSRMLTGATQTYDIYGPYAAIPHAPGASIEFADDFLYVTQMDGNWRQLTPADYEFTKLSIPGNDKVRNSNDIPLAPDVYPITVYAVQNGETITDDAANLVWSGYLTEERQEITFPAGTTAWMCRLTGIMETINKFAVTDTVKFHLDETPYEAHEKADLVNGIVANTAFGFLRNENGTWLNVRTAENYIDDEINLDLVAKDMETYGGVLDREEAFIYLYEGEKSTFSATTSVGEIHYTGKNYRTDVTIGADFDFAEEDVPEKFSLYTILPKGLVLDGYEEPEDIWDILSLSGMGLSKAALTAACTPEIITDYSGQVYIGLHFDLTGKAPQDGKIRAVLKTATTREYFEENRSSVYVRSCVLMDQSQDLYRAGKYADNGNWYNALWSDIDRDGDREELLAWNAGSRGIYYVDSSQFEFNKSVRTDHTSGSFVQYPSSYEPAAPLAEYGSTYTYLISLKNGNSLATDIVFTDILETGPDAQWKGTFQSIDLSAAEAQGLEGRVLYSASETPGPVGGEDWSETMSPAAVKTVAVDFGGSVLEAGKELDIYINMTAPADASLKDTVTENGYTASFTMIDEATGNVTQADSLASNLVQVRLTSKRWTLVLTKKDGTSGTNLPGAVFTLTGQNSGDVFEGTTNAAGRIIFKDLDSDETYALSETGTPEGYYTAGDITVSSPDGTTKRVTVTDERKPAMLTVKKVSDLGGAAVPGAVFAITHPDGSVLERTTDPDGLITLTGLSWGDYTIRETQAPAGYGISEEEQTVTLGPTNTEEALTITVKDRQDDTTVRLTKYEALTDGTHTETVLSGAVFGLYRASDDRLMGTYVTGTDGTITVTKRLAYGDYYWKETRPPAGYVKDTARHTFTISPDNQDPSVAVDNKRRPGFVLLTKTSDLGGPVPEAVYTLYKEDRETAVQSGTTDEYGILELTGLEWGTYYLKETTVPQGFEEDTVWHEITVGKNSVAHDLAVTEITKKGSVLLTKVDAETKAARLQGAVYALYTTDGALVSGGHTTGDNGTLLITDIPWGSYYLKETEAPAGYGLSSESIRFSVNAANAGKVQSLFAEDPKDVKNVVITKKIRAEDINFANGEPCFIFRLSGTDVNGTERSYENIVRFSRTSITDHTDADGWVSAQCYFNGLTAGTYTAVEIDTARYELASVDHVTGGTVGQDAKSAVFDLVENGSGSASFYNVRYEHGYFSETSIIDNIVRAKARLTSISAVWTGETEQETGTTIDKNLITVKAFYDDGTEKIVAPDDFSIDLNTLPMQAGQYTIRVTYVEDGVTYQDSFDLTAGALRPGTVLYDANGGYFFEDSSLTLNKITYTWNGKTNEIAYGTYAEPEISAALHLKFDGWYTDRECTTALNLKQELTEGIVAYAKWTEIPPDVKYAVYIYGIGQDTDENGNTMGLTFGPAVGANYFDTYVNHEPTGVTALGNPHRCIHDDVEEDGWDLVIYWNNLDPEVYEQCIGDAETQSCTTHVDIWLNDTLKSTSKMKPLAYTGDGSGTIRAEIKDVLRGQIYKWNGASRYWTHAWPCSRARAVLNGYDEDTYIFPREGYVLEDEAGTDILEGGQYEMTENTCLFSCFPQELQAAIGKRKTTSLFVGNANGLSYTKKIDGKTYYYDKSKPEHYKVTYDYLWYFSFNNLAGDEDAYENNTVREIQRQYDLPVYQRQVTKQTKVIYTKEMIAYGRNGWGATNIVAVPWNIKGTAILASGDPSIGTAQDRHGISPGFALRRTPA